MKSLTNTKDCLVNSNDEDVYLAWSDMQLNFFGDKIIDSTENVDNICRDKDPLHRIMFPGIDWNSVCLSTVSYIEKHYAVDYVSFKKYLRK